MVKGKSAWCLLWNAYSCIAPDVVFHSVEKRLAVFLCQTLCNSVHRCWSEKTEMQNPGGASAPPCTCLRAPLLLVTKQQTSVAPLGRCITAYASLWPAYLMRHGPFLARLVFSNEKACANPRNPNRWRKFWQRPC